MHSLYWLSFPRLKIQNPKCSKAHVFQNTYWCSFLNVLNFMLVCFCVICMCGINMLWQPCQRKLWGVDCLPRWEMTSLGLVCSFHCGFLGSNLEVVRLIIGKCFIFLSQGSIFPGCPKTDYVDQADLKFRDPTAELFLPSARELKSMCPAQVFFFFFSLLNLLPGN